MKKNNSGFSIIEILIWIFIFTMWLVSIYALLISTMKLNEYSKNSIIATNLAREWVENVRNVRDSNYKNLYRWNKLPWTNVNSVFLTWVYYKVENDLTPSSLNNVKFETISDFWEWKNELNWKMQSYKLCLNSNNQYTYDCSWENKQTIFYRYVKFSWVNYNDWWEDYVLEDSIKVTSKVIWYSRWYNEVQLDTVLTDFLRQ